MDGRGLTPWVPAIQGTRGCALVDLGKLDEGIDLLRKALKDKENQDKSTFASYLALAFAKKGLSDESHKLIEEARRFKPNCPVLARTEKEISSAADRDGHYLRHVDLEKVWRRKPTYVSGLGRDIEGGVIVDDSQGSPPFVRMKPDGTVRSDLRPKYPDGRTVDNRGIETAADGHLWTCDGHSLLRLNESGVVDRVLGASPKSAQLGQIAGVFVDPQDRIYVVDSRTGSMHVFDASGQFSHLCQTKPADFSREISFPAVTFNNKGEVYLGLGDRIDFFESQRPYLRFSDRGTRLENVRLPARNCDFQSGTGNVVAMSYEEVTLVDPAGKVIRAIRRGADGTWLEHPDQIALAPDGSIAILSRARRTRRLTLNLYKANGDAVRTIRLAESIDGFPRLAYDGRRVVVAAETGLFIYNGLGAPIQHSRVPVKVSEGNYYYPYILAGGRELALFDGKIMALHRFVMP